MEHERPLAVVVQTPFRGPGNLPAIYATPEEQGRITGYVEYNSADERKGEKLELYFRTKSEARWLRSYGQSVIVFHNKEILQMKTWKYDLPTTATGLIAAGKSRFDFEVILDPHCPSSIKGNRGWLNYRLRLTLRRKFPRRNIVTAQDVWVFSSCLPAPGPIYLPREPSVYSGIWEDRLPFTITLPATSIQLGEMLPVYVKFEPFLKTSGHLGQELIVVDAVIKLKQYTRLWHKWDVKTETKQVLEMPVNDGWPTTSDGFERMIEVPIPPAPRLSCTAITRVVRKTHCLKLIMHVHTNTSSAKEARELRIEMDVNITGPRPPTDIVDEELPPYSLTWQGDDRGDDSD
ncbi:hypothetical protein BGZ94_002522 [Podila epigama]|nr:hypothetical protein BGZ94_002522 [Podila epigama]